MGGDEGGGRWEMRRGERGMMNKRVGERGEGLEGRSG